MLVLRDYELWSLAKLNVELMSSGTTGIRQETRNEGLFEMNFTHTIDMFTGRLALGPGRVLDLVGHTAPDQFPTQLIRLCCLARLRSNCK